MSKQSLMDFRRLRLFLTVVEEGGFTKAADALGMSQPAVSQAVRELERELGTLLFHRLGRSVALTPAGEALVAPARQVMRDVETGRAAVEAVAGVATGRLDLAALPTLVGDPLAPVVGAFRAAHPGVRIVLADPEDTTELVAFVLSGRSELGITEHVDVSGLVVHSLGEQEFLVVLPPGWPAPPPGALRALRGAPLVAGPPGSSARRVLDEALERAGIVPDIAVETAQREALLPFIVSGAGAGLLPRPLAEMATRLGCTVSEPRPRIARRISVVHREGPLTPAARRFVDVARQHAGSGASPPGSRREVPG